MGSGSGGRGGPRWPHSRGFQQLAEWDGQAAAQTVGGDPSRGAAALLRCLETPSPGDGLASWGRGPVFCRAYAGPVSLQHGAGRHCSRGAGQGADLFGCQTGSREGGCVRAELPTVWSGHSPPVWIVSETEGPRPCPWGGGREHPLCFGPAVLAHSFDLELRACVPPGAAVTKDRTLGWGPEPDKLSLSQFRSRESKIQMWAGPSPSGRSRTGTFLPRPASEASGVPGLVATWLQPPSCLHRASPVSLCVLFSYKSPVIGSGPPSSRVASSSLGHICKDPICKNGHNHRSQC